MKKFELIVIVFTDNDDLFLHSFQVFLLPDIITEYAHDLDLF